MVLVCFCVGGGCGMAWNLNGLAGSYLGVRMPFVSLFWLDKFLFFIYLKGEHEGTPIPNISTAANFDFQLTIYSIVILNFGSKFNTFDKKDRAISGNPSVSWSNGSASIFWCNFC